MAQIRAVLFDYVHTLVDSGDIHALQFGYFPLARRRLVQTFPSQRSEIPLILYQVLSHVNGNYSGSYRRGQLEEVDIHRLFAEGFRQQGFPVDDKLLDHLVALNHDMYAQRLVVPTGTRQSLEHLKRQGLRLGVVSNNMFQRRWMSTFPLLFLDEGLLDVVVLSSDVGVRKPGERIYREALERLGVNAAETVFVGDRVSEDVRAPKALGMPSAFLTYEFRREPDPRCEADGILLKLPDLLKWVSA
ncbi:MAG: HAD family hydrolase [Dehalococcoidia bacterium]|nr:HAD family hydrolase [Dehalococcoidia bacterium]